MKKISYLFLLVSAMTAGCAVVAEKTNMLSDEKIVAQSANALGFATGDLTLVSRTVDGTNTYVNLKYKNKQEYTCIINGGNILTMGMTNPPSCGKKGEPIKTNPFQ